MKNIDMIVMDMDGTLLTSQQKILPYTKDILMNLQKQGVALVLASGRDVSSLEYYGKQLEMDQYFQSGYIVLNGLEIYNSKKECLHQEQRLTKDDLMILNEIAQTSFFDMIIFFETCLYIFDYGHTGIMDIRLHKRAGPVIRLQITPEKPLMDADLIGGETLQGDIHRFLKYIRLYVLLQKDGKPVNGRKVPSLQCGVYNSGKIQPVPVLRRISGRLAVFIICTHMKCHRLYSFL